MGNDTIALFLNASLAAQAVEEVQEHIDQCPSCFRLLGDLLQAGQARTPEAPPPPDKQVGRYTLLGRVGSGGMAEVYAAYDPHLRRELAIKVLRPSRIDDPGAGARLLREARALARLSHPNIIKVYDVGSAGTQIFIAMKLVDGWTLRSWLQHRQRDLPEVLTVFLQAGRGLFAAHAAGIVHRDFKPENVLLCKDGRVLVSDFGLARVLEEDEDRKALVGTPAYMAPEQYLGQPVSPQTDQFAFCVTLYEALYGERPFLADDRKDLRREIIEGRVRPAPPDRKRGVPAWLRTVLLRGLSVSPDDRHPSMEALCQALAPAAPHSARSGGYAALLVLLAGSMVLLGAHPRRAPGISAPPFPLTKRAQPMQERVQKEPGQAAPPAQPGAATPARKAARNRSHVPPKRQDDVATIDD